MFKFIWFFFFFTKEHFGLFFFPILCRNSLVVIRLCKNVNWNSISLVLFVHLEASRYASPQLMHSSLFKLQSLFHFG